MTHLFRRLVRAVVGLAAAVVLIPVAVVVALYALFWAGVLHADPVTSMAQIVAFVTGGGLVALVGKGLALLLGVWFLDSVFFPQDDGDRYGPRGQ